MAVHNRLYMSDPEKVLADGDVASTSPDQGLVQLGNFVSQATMVARASSAYQAACRRSDFPAASAILYDDEEMASPCSETDDHLPKG